MKPRYFIANWKMKLSPDASVKLLKALAPKVKKFGQKVELIFCPGFVALAGCTQAVKGTALKLGAQDVFWVDKGSFTGEVSPLDLQTIGCQYVILGHSERRKHLGETDAMVNKKIVACLKHGLTPIVCVGENWEQRQEGQATLTLEQQTRNCFQNIMLKNQQQLIICYEPVWAISDNLGERQISAADVEPMVEVIKQGLYEVLSVDQVESSCHFIYGGSVDSGSLNNFLQLDTIEGGLVGAASLEAEEVVAMVKILANR